MDFRELYNKLLYVRDRLKQKYYSNGRTPTICSDDALYELAQKAPRHKEDLIGINGLGQTFVDKYGDYFMQILYQYHKKNTSTKELKTEVKNTLKNLENRLVNISKRNRLLYMGKIYNKYALDLHTSDKYYNSDVIDLLMGKKDSLVLCETSIDDWDVDNEKRFKKTLQLLREITKEFRESGQYDLYIGYPYVMGRSAGENFNVRAPLVLFPIEFDRQHNKVIIKIDNSKDILYNNNLILMQNKFLNKNEELPNNVLDDVDEDIFFENIVDFYREHGIEIIENSGKLEKFYDITVNDFPRYKNGEFHIVNNAVLGKFSLYSSALQKDFKQMINDSEINELLDELLTGMDSTDFYSDEVYLEEKEDENEAQMCFSERNLNYINELNSSQEQAIMNIDKKNKLVIQGPPGTGKSQTITSLIADTVNKGHNVVMVSQKKAALDVIYSRLGNLSNFAIMLNDVKDKELFYKQLFNLFSCNKSGQYQTEEFNNISEDIDKSIKELELIASNLYSTKINGIEMYKIYQDNDKNSFNGNENELGYYYRAFDNNLLKINYLELKKIKEKFTNEKLLDDCARYVSITNSYPWLKDMKENIGQIARIDMMEDFNKFIQDQIQYFSYNILKKMFTYRKRNKELESLYSKYFNKNSSKRKIYQNPKALLDGVKFYSEYQGTKALYSSLSSNEQLYVRTISKINTNSSLQEINNKLFDSIIYSIIDDYENNNRGLFANIGNFTNIVSEISKLISKKKDITKKKLKSILINSYNKEITYSKRYNEMCRQIESSRKWSVSKFVKKFSFELFKGIKIWLMTPETVSEVLPLENGLFDLLIFDEASQIYIEKGIPAISRAQKVVIAGDHKQLRPSSLGMGRIDIDDENNIEEEVEINAALEEESLLDLARFKYPSVLLNYHYRSMYEELINFSNYAFYNGKLNVSPNTEEPDSPPIEVIKIDNGFWTNRCNRNEALKVVETIKMCLKERKNQETLGVITFNSSQRDIIMDELDQECLKDQEFSIICKKEFDRKEIGEDVGLFIKNIENVQGDERDCIIFSTGYAKNESGSVVRNFGWLNQKGGENRLNVAISRAKKKIYLLTSILPDELFVDDLKNEGPKILKKYLEYCFAINKRDKETAKRILLSFGDSGNEAKKEVTFDSDFENQVYDALVEKNLLVHTQVGIGGYKIDLAIRNKANTKYLLGIECDGKLYHSSMTARERDIYRQKYLESRGWKIYRIWSTNWWHNPEKEIEKILKIYSSLEDIEDKKETPKNKLTKIQGKQEKVSTKVEADDLGWK